MMVVHYSNLFFSGTASYFSIIRVSDWTDVEKTTMSAGNERLSYTLGALFGVVALASFIELVSSMATFAKTRNFKPNYIYLIAIYSFTQSMLYGPSHHCFNIRFHSSNGLFLFDSFGGF
jgi:hypothetical protein